MLFDALEQAHAYEMLHDPKVGGQLNAEDYLELVRAAGYPEEAAQRAASERAMERMRRDLPP